MYGANGELPVAVCSSGTAHRKDYLETSIGDRIQKMGGAAPSNRIKSECNLNWYKVYLALEVPLNSLTLGSIKWPNFSLSSLLHRASFCC